MRISLDERDITNILELEQYIKERKYLIRWQEYEKISKIAEDLGPVDIEYHKTLEANYFEIFWVYKMGSEPFYCWTKVDYRYDKKPRHRKFLKNIEEVEDLTSLYYYLSERCFLLNSREFYKLALCLQKWNHKNMFVGDCKVSKVEWIYPFIEGKNIVIPSGIDIQNQVAGHYYMYFEQKEKKTQLDTYVMTYNRLARERRR